MARRDIALALVRWHLEAAHALAVEARAWELAGDILALLTSLETARIIQLPPPENDSTPE